MTSVTLTDLTPQKSVVLTVDSANNSVAISQTTVTPSISMSITNSGENNTITNLGSGAQVYKEKVGTVLNLRSIVGGTGITVTQNADDITVDRDALTTDDVSEGTNLYYTDARSRAAVSATGSISYDNTTGVFSYTQPTNVSAFTNDAGYLTAETITGISSVVDDTSPQLGGNLDTNGFDIDFADNNKATFGTGEDLWIYHDGGSSYIFDRGFGNLRIITNSTVNIDGASGGEFMAQFVSNGAVSLWHDNSKKFDTTSTGVRITGEITTTGGNSTNWQTAYTWGDHSDQGYATETYVDTSVANLVDSAPATLDTLNELAAALGDDPNFATTISTQLGNKLNTADFASTADTWLGTKTTTNLTEGTNLYYTDARARAAISATGDLSYNNTTGVMSFTERTDAEVRGLISASGDLSYNNTTGVMSYTTPFIPADISDLTDTTNLLNNDDLSNNTTSDLAEGTNLYYTDERVDDRVNSLLTAGTGIQIDYDDAGNTLTITNTIGASSGIGLTDLSVTQNTASGNGTLTYNNTNGVFTYTPPDLSSYLTSFTETNDLTAAVTWANVPDVNITETSVTQHEAALSILESQITYTSNFIELTDLSVTTDTASAGGSLSYNNTTGVFTFAPADLTSVAAESSTRVVYTCVNKSGGELVKGTPLAALDPTANAGLTVDVIAADASDPNKMPVIGILNETLANDAEGEMITHGFILGVNTTGFSPGTPVYVAAGGGWTATPPTGESNQIQKLGVVLKESEAAGGGLVNIGPPKATPNLNDGRIFIGNASNQSVTALLDTSIVPENTNLYYTDTRANSAIDVRVTKSFVENLDIDVDGGTY